jgi:hypothetical protein
LFFIPCGTKKSLGFLKYVSVGLESPSEDDMLNRKKWAIFKKKLGKVVFLGIGGIPDPP